MASNLADELRPQHTHAYLWAPVLQILSAHTPGRIIDIGCGSGSLANELHRLGWAVTGIDPSESEVAAANRAYPHLAISLGSAYDDLREIHGTFPAAVSLEVIEHCTSPREYCRQIFNVLEPGGVFILSTPYHGYLKNLALALAGKMDDHYTALWDGGHIKFWSIKTLTALVVEAGFSVERVQRVGRVPVLAKSMIFTLRRNARQKGERY